MSPYRVGVVGCGFISDVYITQMSQTFPILKVVACADREIRRAEARARRVNARAMTVDELLKDESIDIVVNLTTPKSHASVTLSALESGKHVFSEKPLAVSRQKGKEILSLMREKNLRVGSAPDTFLGAGMQTSRKLLDEGIIGEPFGITGTMLVPGHERWHPRAEFYYQEGGGPLFDMGPYYLTAMINLLGPIRSVSALAMKPQASRILRRGPRRGEAIQVEIPTYVAGLLSFASGARGTLLLSFDVRATEHPHIEVYGTEGTLSVPDPDCFGGSVRLNRGHRRGWGRTHRGWEEMPLVAGYSDNSRGIGAADLAHALRSGRDHRASSEMAYHVLDVAHGLYESIEQDRHIPIESTCERPEPLPQDLPVGILDD